MDAAKVGEAMTEHSILLMVRPGDHIDDAVTVDEAELRDVVEAAGDEMWCGLDGQKLPALAGHATRLGYPVLAANLDRMWRQTASGSVLLRTADGELWRPPHSEPKRILFDSLPSVEDDIEADAELMPDTELDEEILTCVI